MADMFVNTLFCTSANWLP